MRKLILWGGTGQAIVLYDFLSDLDFNVIAIFDNNTHLESPFRDIPIFYGLSGFKKWLSTVGKEQVDFIVSIGGDKGKDRIFISEYLISQHLSPVSAIHPTAILSPSVDKGIGIQVMANSCIAPRTIIGDYSIINTSTSIDHECLLGKGVHIAPGVTMAGCVQVGENTFIGAGAVILPRIAIGSNTIVGAGAVVTKDLPNNVVAYGVPAKIIKTNY